jgi:hypothetical protein
VKVLTRRVDWKRSDTMWCSTVKFTVGENSDEWVGCLPWLRVLSVCGEREGSWVYL